jgi:predicted RNase H-like nuclease
MTKTQKVTNALLKGPLTAAQISSRFNVPNVRAMIYDLKRKNLNVMRTTTSKGLTAYRVAA